MVMNRDDQPEGPAPERGRTDPPDQFVWRMFSGMGHPAGLPPAPHDPAPHDSFHPLRQSKALNGERYYLRRQASIARVQAGSPATAVMTDLTEVAAVTIRGLATIDEAEQAMIAHRVRALFVVDDDRAVLGIITSTDVAGENPIRLARERGIRHDEVVVGEIMIPADRLEAMEFDDVRKARVGDIIATLELSGRQHALVIERASADSSGPRTVRGIFSLTQIARQLGLPPQSAHDIARTFAEIKAVSGS